MFDEKYLDQFYNRELLTDPDRVTPDLKQAYFMYVDIFCKATSSFWRKYINNELIMREEGQYTPNLTTSDEALTLWLLHEEYPKAKLDAVEISRVGTAEWNKSRDKRKRGQHTTVAKQSNYVSLKAKFCRSGTMLTLLNFGKIFTSTNCFQQDDTTKQGN